MSTVHRQQQQQQQHVAQQHSFNENSPRPPVPGEECAESGSRSPAWAGPRFSHKGGSSPVLTPRRSSLAANSPYAGDGAPLGFEPEGACGLQTTDACSSPPAYLRWARTLLSLLEDSEGVELFRRYLEAEGRNYADTLDFWFACEGLKKQREPDKIAQLVKVIYRRFFLKTQLSVTEELRKAVNQRIKDSRGPVGGDVFDAVQREVERLINDTTYPNFLKSDMYLQHVQAMQGSSQSTSASSGSSSAENVPAAAQGMLPTLHEDAELSTGSSGDHPLPLTRDMLLVTQKRRAAELRPKPEAYAGLYLQHTHPSHYPHPSHFPHPLHAANQSHAAYSSYNPVSRQDSELQSLSSDARTESDNMSLTDSSVDGISLGRNRLSKKQYLRHCKHMKESASMNQDPSLHHTVIPRTYRIQKDQVHPMDPDAFAAILVEKLESVRRERDAQDKLDRKLQEGDCGMSSESVLSPDCAPPRSLADAIREKLQVEDDNCQDILDQHVSRVWSDLTPLRSPSVSSPRPKSPEGQLKVKSPEVPAKSRRLQLAAHPGGRVPHCARHSRKDKDVFSTFSSDSGNVHDFPEEHRHLPKSKSMPDYQQDLHASASQGGHGDGRFVRSSGRDSSRRSSSKKGSTELTDSGVSVVSDSSHSGPSLNKDSRVLTWLLESHDKLRGSAQGAATSPMPPRHSSKRPDRSGSLERSGVSSWPGPAQPFVADPSMPPLPLPHTATQLEEARRRLMEEEGRRQMRFSLPSKSCEMPVSAQSTLRKSSRARATAAAEDFTTVVFSFCDEQFPYRTKIPGKHVTLKQFKEFLPKKGSYRYFFKTECEDLDTRVIQEEITDDLEVLPLWEGKVMAQVKPVE